MHLVPWRRRRSEMEHHDQPGSSVPLHEFRSRFDQLFDRFLADPWSMMEEPWAGTSAIMPAVDLSETDNMITIRAEVPGMEPDDIDVQVSGNTLTIAGEKKESREEGDEEYLHCERRLGRFRRSIELPASADPEQIEAEFKNGVLEIRVQKSPRATSRHINVQAAKDTGQQKPVGTA